MAGERPAVHDTGVTPSPGSRGTPRVDVLSEAFFLQALSLERKRAERSGKRFVLMLVEAGQTNGNGNGHGHLLRDRVMTSILSSIRDTDIPGWYATGRVLGVIFTELGDADRQMVLTVLRSKVTAALQATAHAEQHVRISFHCFPEDGEPPTIGWPRASTLYPEITLKEEATRASRAVKRLIDLLGSALALLVLAPLFLVLAAAIKLTSPGPVLFRQQRIGQFGVPFTFLKFRSMYVKNDFRIHQDFVKQFINGNGTTAPTGQNGQGVYKITNDPRVTRVGRFLRRTSLDELPQFINVLRGEMALVGPRPPIQYELEMYLVWHRRRLLEVKPGITGLWQVTGRSRLSFDDMVRLDLQYARVWSPWLDLKILFLTPRAVISRTGAY